MDSFIREIKLVSGARRRLERHFHEEYSLAFLLSGTSHARAWDGEHPVAGGDIVLIPPRFPHACNPDADEPWSYALIALAPRWTERAASWAAAPRAILRVPDEALVARCRLWITTASADRGEAEKLARDALSAIALARPGEDEGRRVPPGIVAARQYIDAHLDGKLTLDELAAMAGLSKYRFLRVFGECYGLTPHAYILSSRINRAKRLLLRGEDIGAAAYECGFCDQSHFSRTFSARVGLTPGRYSALRDGHISSACRRSADDNFVQDAPRLSAYPPSRGDREEEYRCGSRSSWTRTCRPDSRPMRPRHSR